ncbi:MAG TPA: 23S rRNA (guanosine(2251)-2'-O)-methyltransferase RlmB [Solirubrobacterales bacterium]|nr:23S rRNA (guanosine(2251)-2'-O)-methyltransferase RlmB [Solirubrobacterales bacterium]
MSAGGNLVYGRRPVMEAKRGRRRVLRTWTAEVTSPEELTRLAGSPDHQGIVAEVEPYPYVGADELLRPDALIVALDQVQDPHNLGAVARSAEAAGATGLVIPDRRSAAVTPAVCKASAGAVEHLRIARVGNLADWLTSAKETEGLWVYGADAEGSEPYSSLDLKGPVVLVLGSEGSGIRPRVAATCDVVASIPLAGQTSSLNVSAAAAVLLFEAVRQRQG